MGKTNKPKVQGTKRTRNETSESNTDEIQDKRSKGSNIDRCDGTLDTGKPNLKPRNQLTSDVRRVLIKPSNVSNPVPSSSKNNNAVPSSTLSKTKRSTRSGSNLKDASKVHRGQFDKFDEIDQSLEDNFLDAIVDIADPVQAPVFQDGIEIGVNQEEDDLDADMSKQKQVQDNATKLKNWKDDPEFLSYVDQMLEKKLEKRENAAATTATVSTVSTASETESGQSNSLATPQIVVEATPRAMKNIPGQSRENANATIAATTGVVPSPIRAPVPGIKSPSDSTLYTPALQRVNNAKQADDLLNKISNFVEGIRIEQGHSSSEDEVTNAKAKSPEPEASGTNREEMERARQLTDDLILQSEQFKANVVAPQGMEQHIFLQRNNFMQDSFNFMNPLNNISMRNKFIMPNGLAPVNQEIQWLRNFDQDDEFFHVTCHVDDTMKSKIVKGEFVDLERLLHKDKMGISGGKVMNDDSLFKFGVKEGHPYVAPINEGQGKINSVRKWDQAFRVYAAIYTEANPTRASEIWQYVYVIHTAATNIPWENVAYYDYTFRQLMASKPLRSWEKLTPRAGI